jgi:hypothetical protein
MGFFSVEQLINCCNNYSSLDSTLDSTLVSPTGINAPALNKLNNNINNIITNNGETTVSPNAHEELKLSDSKNEIGRYGITMLVLVNEVN